jgi:hypothetical protein
MPRPDRWLSNCSRCSLRVLRGAGSMRADGICHKSLVGCIVPFLAMGISAAVAEVSEFSCSGTATFLQNSKLPATVNRMLVRIDLDNGVVSGFAHRLSIISAGPELIKVTGTYRGAAGPVQIRGSINLASGRIKVWGNRGAKGRGPLVFLWQLICKSL